MSDFWGTSSFVAAEHIAIRLGTDAAPVSYAALREHSELWRDRILALSESPGDLVVLEFETSVEAIAAYLGALNAGRPLLLVEPGQAGPNTRLRSIYAPEIVIGRNAPTSPLAAYRVEPRDRQDDQRPSDAHPDLALLLSTSGSTGDPKLVRLSAENIRANAASIGEYLKITQADRAMLTLPLFYSYGLSVLNSHLTSGASVVLNDLSVVDPGFWPAFRASGATSLALVPHQFDLLERAGFLGQASDMAPKLRYITQAGGRLDPATVRRFAEAGRHQGWDLVLMYGQTEASPRMSWVPPERLPDAADTIGKAIPGGRLWIADEVGNRIDTPGMPGELVYEGPNVMMGYATSRADLARGDETAELHTGDLAELTDDGLFRITGRLKRFVKLYGLRLSLDQIEALLSEKGLPAEAVALEDNLVLLHTGSTDGAAARDIVAEAYDIPPSGIHVAAVADIPRLASGKTDRPALDRIAAQALASGSTLPRRPTGSGLAEALAQATRTRHVAPTDSFTSLGGDSLSYIDVQLAIEQRLGHTPDGWENMTLAELEALSPTARSTRRWTQINIDVLLRLVAIALVVASHSADYPLFGGTWLLILLMGYSAARFQFPTIRAGRGLKLAAQMLYPIIPLYYLIVFFYEFTRGGIVVHKYLLVDNYQLLEETAPLLEPFWFVSLYTQIVLLFMLITWIAPLRRIVTQAPFKAAMVVAFVPMAAVPVLDLLTGYSNAVVTDWPVPYVTRYGLFECIPLVALGWMLFTKTTAWQTVVSILGAMAAAVLLVRMGLHATSALLIVGSALLLAFRVRIALPGPVATLLNRCAGLTLFVYLLHSPIAWFVGWSNMVDLPRWLAAATAITASFGVAFVAKALFDLAERELFKAVPGSKRTA